MSQGGSNAWSSPFDLPVIKAFRDEMMDELGAGGVVNERTTKWSFLIGPTEHGSANQCGEYDAILLANADATAAGPTDTTAAGTGRPSFPTTSPSEPKIDAKGLVPVGTSLLIGGIGVVVFVPLVWARAYESTPTATIWDPGAVAEDAFNGIMAAFDAGLVKVNDARNEKVVVSGHEACSYGAGRLASYGPPTEVNPETGVADVVLYSGAATYKDRGWSKIAPVKFSGGGGGVAQSQIQLLLQVPRSTDWPVRPTTRIRVDVMTRALVAYQGSAGNVACDPAATTPGMGQRTQPKQYW